MVSLSEKDNRIFLKNEWKKVEFNIESGRFSIFDINSEKNIVNNAYAMVRIYTIDEGKGKSAGKKKPEAIKISLTDDYKRTWKIDNSKDEIGSGKKAIIKQFNVEFQIVLILEITLYDNIDAVQVQISIENNTENKYIEDFFPVYLTQTEDSGELNLGSIEDLRVLKIGYQSWSNSRIMNPFDEDRLPSIGWARFPHHFNYHESRPSGQIRSNYFTIIKNIKTEENILFGFLTHKNQHTQVILDFDEKNKKFVGLRTRSQADGIIIKRDETIKSEQLLILYSDQDIKNILKYSELTGKISSALQSSENIRGYCTWYNYYENITEKDCLDNLVQLRANKSNKPIDYFQLDDGYQIVCGDWPEPANKKFPHGMKWLVEKIKEPGLKPGLWIAPFLISPLSKVYKEHPDWVVKNEKGKPIAGAWNPNLYGGSVSKFKFFRGIFSTLYVLDTTNPEVQDWLYNLFSKIVDDWGFEYIKIDFIYAAALKGIRHERVTRIQAYRKGLEIIRSAVSDDTFILGCGAPLASSIGLVNGMRVSCDTAPAWDPFYSKLSRKLLKLPSTPAVLPAMANNMLLSFFHRNWWINDPDCLMIRKKNSGLSLNEVRTQITLIGLTNGIYMISDNLTTLDVDRFRLIRKFIPVDDISALPLDLFDSEFVRPNISPCHIYDRKVETEFDSWHITGLFNWNDETEEDLILKLSDIGLNPDKKYHVFEFWSEKYLGTFQNEIIIPKLYKHSCHLLRICEVRNFPQLIGSTFHFLQGKAEIINYQFDEESLQIKIDMEFPGYNQEDLIIYTPTRLYPYGSEHESINCNCEIVKAEPHYLIINVEFTDSATLTIDLSKGD
ncbi:MAG: hypothetical protein GF329_14395 [Candidatus Lokiarchaeota archaeon]|nr:hypothetical protein [Candidatus Lokiarchaeota archaeon]